MLDDLMAKLDGKNGELDRLRMEKDQEIAILQAGMDQSLLTLHEFENKQQGNSKELQDRLDKMRAENLARLNKILGIITVNIVLTLFR